MSFLWQYALWLLACLPVLAAVYVMLDRRPRRGLRYAATAPVREARDPWRAFLRHAPALLFGAALAIACVALARPVLPPRAGLPQRTVMLAIDASASMQAGDAAPSRLAVAQAAARELIESQPADVRIGVIAFGHYAELMHAPSADRARALAAIDAIELYYGSGIGTGLLAALVVLFPDAKFAQPFDIFGFRAPAGYREGTGVAASNLRASHLRGGAGHGGQAESVIVLLSDGSSTGGVPVRVATAVAAERGVRVHTVGVGTAAGGYVDFAWGREHVGYEARPLADIARATAGRFFAAGPAAAREPALEALQEQAVFEPRGREVTVIPAALAAVLVIAASVMSLSFSRRQNAG